MLKLDSGNVLLKPSQRRQLMTRLRRAMKLGQRIGKFTLNLTMNRCGKCCEILLSCQDKLGAMTVKVKRHDWKDALHDAVHRLENWLHEHRCKPAMASF